MFVLTDTTCLDKVKHDFIINLGITVSCVELLVHWTFLHDYEFAMIERAVEIVQHLFLFLTYVQIVQHLATKLGDFIWTST